MLRVGLTGGICAGKSTVTALFRELDVPIVDADELAHALVAPGQPALRAIVERFGDDVLTSEGALDRQRMRERVFAHAEERKALEAILHPAIRERTRRLLSELEQAGAAYAINVVPLLVEAGLTDTVDRVLVVDVPADVQLQRLMARDGIDATQAQRMLDAQASRQQRLDVADDVIRNDTSLAALRVHVQELHTSYRQRAAGAAPR